MNSNKMTFVLLGQYGSPSEYGGEITKNKEIVAGLRKLGYKVYIIDSKGSNHDYYKLLKVAMKLFWHAVNHRKATFIFSTSFVNIYPLFKYLKKLPWQLRIVNWVIGGNMGILIKEKKYKIEYLKVPSLYVVEGNKMIKQFSEKGLDNTLYIPNFKHIEPWPQLNKFNDGKIHFIFLSRIMPEKGVDYILQSAKILNKEGFQDRYVIDFYGPVNEEYKNRFHSLCDELQNVNYCGQLFLHHTENYNIISKYHYMLFPTYWVSEGFPGVVLDAYISGLPIIASDWNFNKEFIKDGETGIIVPTHSLDGLVQAIRTAIKGRNDYSQLVKNCRSKASFYDTFQQINKETISRFYN